MKKITTIPTRKAIAAISAIAIAVSLIAAFVAVANCNTNLMDASIACILFNTPVLAVASMLD